MTATTATTDRLRRLSIEREFAATCDRLAEARHRQRQKDSPSNRALVADCWARVDAVLDLALDAEG
jgi:hypothetical protein